jgi:hypothetical protein
MPLFNPAKRATQSANGRSDEADYEEKRPPWLVLAIVIAVSVAVIVAYSLYASPLPLVLAELILATASLVSGGFVGFLFGIPRAVPTRSVAIPGAGTGGDATTTDYEPSNNLEQIADWLTKILIGIGLVELQELTAALGRVGDRMAAVFGVPSANIVSQLVLVTFVVTGFLASFLWTRVYYGKIQTIADVDVRSILMRLRNAERSAKTAEKISTDLVTGELTPGVPARTATAAAMLARNDPVSALPDAVRDRISQLREWDPLDWDSDPLAGLFPDAPREANGRRLEASIDTVLARALIIKLTVRRISGPALQQPVLFLLHPTFGNRVEIAIPKGDVAEIKIVSEGWFTAGAIADGGDTVLAYSLNKLPNAPKWFVDQ